MKKNNVFDVINNFIIFSFSMFCLLPIVLILAISFTSEKSINQKGYQLIPSEFSLNAYTTIFKNGSSIAQSYAVTTLVTLIGTIIAVFITLGVAFCLANKQVKYRNSLAFFFFFTLIFSGGLVPWYLISTRIGLRDNIFALIIPSLMFNAFNMFLVRNYMAGIPDSLMESAKIDGAGEITIAFRIYFPMCIPVLAAVALFYALAYWNDWWNAIMLVDNRNLHPLQYILFKLQSEISMLREMQNVSAGSVSIPPTESLKMATAIITIGPVVLLYPFLQRFFIKGLVIGAVKG